MINVAFECDCGNKTTDAKLTNDDNAAKFIFNRETLEIICLKCKSISPLIKDPLQ